MPLPAGATHRTGPGGAVAAARWSGARRASRAATSGCIDMRKSCAGPLIRGLPRSTDGERPGFAMRPNGHAAHGDIVGQPTVTTRSGREPQPPRTSLIARPHVRLERGGAPCPVVPSPDRAGRCEPAGPQPARCRDRRAWPRIDQPSSRSDHAVFFAADGLRQDLVERYADQGVLPTMRSFLRNGTYASRQRPADPGAAEHRRRLVHAGDRRLAGRARLDQQHVPQSTASRFAQPDRGVRPGRAPGRDDRPVRRARRPEGRPDRVGRRPQRHHQRPDGRLPQRSSPVAASRPTSSAPAPTRVRRRWFISVRPPVRPSGRLRRAGAVPGRRADAATGWTNVPASYSPAKEMRLRVLDGGVDKYGLNAYIYDRTNDGTSTTTACCSPRSRTAPTRSPTCAPGELGRRQGHDRRRLARTARPPACWSRSRTLSPDLSQVRLFHTSVTRANATWPTWPGEPGFTGDFAEFLAAAVPDLDRRRLRRPRGRHRQRGDLRRAGPVLGDRPPADARVHDRRRTSRTWPAGRATRRPTSSSTSSSAWSRRRCPTAPPTRPTTTSSSTASRTTGSASARASSGARTRAPTRRCARPHAAWATTRPRSSRPTTASRRSSWRSTPARCWSTSACSRSRRPRNCRPADRRDDRQGQGLLGRRHGPDLPEPRRPRSRPAADFSRCRRRRGGHGRADQGRLPGAERPERLDPRRPTRRAGR